MTDIRKPAAVGGKALDAAIDAEAARLRLAKRASDVVDASTAVINRLATAAKGGGKLSRSETVTVRLDPKLRYLAELAARKQRRTVSSYIEWAIEESLDKVVLSTRFDGSPDEEITTLADMADSLWDVDPSERFAKLAITHESLLTHDEQVLWKHIEDSGLFAKGWVPPKKEGMYWQPGRPDWVWLRKVGFPLLRDHWDTLCKVASGELDRSHLPRFEK